MKKIIIVATALAMLFACNAPQKDNSVRDNVPEIRFKDGRLRIAQFTDVHWHAGWEDKRSDEFLPALIKSVAESQKPDVLVFTGDVVTEIPVMQGWKQFVDLMHEIGLPYAVVMGNHDPEAGTRPTNDGKEVWTAQQTRDSIFTYLEKSPLFIGEKGPSDIKGMGNYVVPVLASDGSSKVQSLLYCMDSNDYTDDERISDSYGWFTYDQIEWYRQQSQAYTEANGGAPLPALAFFHIPLPEHDLIKSNPETIGNRLETVCCAGINSGMFYSMFDMKDVMGVFVGHDHNNDYIGEYHGIALAYGKATGIDTYGDYVKGARIIEMHEGERTFDTWLISENGREGDYTYPAAPAPVAD